MLFKRLAFLFFLPLIPLSANECCPSYLNLAPPSEPCTFNLEYLFWQPRRSDLMTAFLFVEDSTLATKSPTPRWDSGFRAGIFSDVCDLDVGFTYTYFRSKGSIQLQDRQDASDTVVVINQFFYPNELETESLRSNYSVRLDQFDLEFSRTFSVFQEKATAAPFFGFRAALIDQRLINNSISFTFIDHDDPPENGEDFPENGEDFPENGEDFPENGEDPTPLQIAGRSDASVKMNAFGFYGGVDTHYFVCPNFSFFLKGSLGLYVSKQKIKSSFEFNELTPEPENISDGRIFNNYWQHVLSSHLHFGFEYDLCMFQRSDWKLRIGYEFNIWSQLPSFLNAYINEGEGIESSFQYLFRQTTLGFDGLTVGLSGTF